MSEMQPKIRLDTPTACREELERVSNALVTLTTEYQAKYEKLADVEAQLDFLRARTLIGTEGANKEEREAKVYVALREDDETLAVIEEWDRLRVEVAILKQRFKTLEARGSHAQSANKSHEQESRFVGRANL